jgi:class 3 adenylate cyclase
MAPAQPYVFMMTDVVDSTSLNAAAGDELWAEVLALHDSILWAQIGEVGGTIVKHLGDGVFATFPTAPAALQCASRIQQAFPVALPGLPEAALKIRIGLHAGTAIHSHHDLFGLAVTLTARVCNHAAGGQVLLTEAIWAASRWTEAVTEVGQVMLKGFDQPIRLLALGLHEPPTCGDRLSVPER